MAPLGSSEAAQTRFNGGFCSSSQSMAPSPMAGLGFETMTHPHQFAHHSSASPEDPTFHSKQQVRQFYFQHQQAVVENGEHDAPASTDVHMASRDMDMVEELPKVDENIEQPTHNYVQENLSAAPGLIRYHSAPSSMLASLTGMGDAILNQGARGLNGNNNRCNATGGVSYNNGLISYPSAYQPVSGANGDEQNFAGVSTDLKGKNIMFLASDAAVEASRKAHKVPSSCPPKTSLLPKNPPLENGNGIVHGVPMTRNSLLRQSSSPAGLLYQLNDNNEMLMLGSSSGNSSEEGSYGSYTWDEAGNVIIGSPNASSVARKRIRDLEEKYFLGPTLKDEEHGVLGNYFGLHAATSPETVYFPDKLSPDSVLCRARAKRGCATHPRSIAERNRRTKISERMKKLQELVPNMDKQTNTAEMLDEAVEYVKYLKKQVQELSENRAKCTCSCGERKET